MTNTRLVISFNCRRNTYLYGLILEGLVRVVYVLQGDAIELAFVDVRDAVVLPPLRTAARRLQVVLEPVRGKPAANTRNINNASLFAIENKRPA